MTRKRVATLVGLVVVAAAGVAAAVCVRPTFSATAPHGFAAFGGWFELKAVSPEGVVFRVRSEANEPKAELSFWREALKRRMLDAGYTFVGESDIRASDRAGYLLELAAPQGAMDYSYLAAVFVDGSHLVIAEAAGEVTKLRERRQDLVAAIAAIKM
jgi:hypothetical protein